MMKLSGPTTAILTDGMGGRLRHKHGQLVALKDRLTPQQQAKRTARVQARRTVADVLTNQQNAFMLGVVKALNRYFNRGFWGRTKWLLAGK